MTSGNGHEIPPPKPQLSPAPTHPPTNCPACGADLFYSDAIGGAIRLLRQRNRLTLDQLAEQSGVSKGNLSRIENGNSDPGLQTLEKIAAAFGMKTSALLTFQEKRKSSEG